MKIVYISDSTIPSRTANSIHVMKFCQALAQLGHEVILLAPNMKNTNVDIDDIYQFYEVEPNFEVRKLNWPEKVKGTAYIYGVIAAMEAKKECPNIVYGRNLIGCYFTALLGLKVNLEVHQPTSKSKKLQNYIFHHLTNHQNFNKLVVISQSLKGYFCDCYSLDTNRILVAHDGADIPSEDICPTNLLGNSIFNVGYVGQLYKGKGMEIISQVAEKLPHVLFHIIGGMEEDIVVWKEKTKNINNLHFYGFVPHAETGMYIKACNVMLAPYLEDVRGHGKGDQNLSKWMSPLKIFEYMSFAKPIVTSDLPVLKEILTEHETALFCKSNDIDTWIHAIRDLRDNPELQTKIGSNAKQTFKDNFTWKKRATKIVDFCK